VSRNEVTVEATVDQVWDVLSDGWLYPLWVVGAARMREVDDHWPAVGARLHHSVGSFPVMLNDVTEVVAAEPMTRLVLRAQAWPIGAGEVTLTLEALGARTRIVMREQAVSGPGALAPKLLQDPVLAWRNTEALRRLSYLVEHRPQTDG